MEKIQATSQFIPKLNIGNAPTKGISDEFGAALSKALAETNNVQVKADRAVENLHSGQGASIPDVMIAMEQADISMRLLVQMRNKVVEAYQEIMRMQV